MQPHQKPTPQYSPPQTQPAQPLEPPPPEQLHIPPPVEQQSDSSGSSPSRSYSSGSESSKQDQGEPGGERKGEGVGEGAGEGVGGGSEAVGRKDQGQGERRIRYKYCCKICKHTDKAKKACVCVVPKNQRRTQIGQQGCQTCGCNGCSKEDFISRGEDPQYKPGQKTKRIRRDRQRQNTQFQARNGCCRKCMKAFSKSNKSCLCQVPQDVRNTRLPSSGCKICGCFGCNPEDKKDPRTRKGSQKHYQHTSRRTDRGDRTDRIDRQRSRSREKKKRAARSKSSSSHSRDYIDPASMNFYNVEKSRSMIINEYRVDPVIMGFGIAQRTHNYIIGKPK